MGTISIMVTEVVITICRVMLSIVVGDVPVPPSLGYGHVYDGESSCCYYMCGMVITTMTICMGTMSMMVRVVVITICTVMLGLELGDGPVPPSLGHSHVSDAESRCYYYMYGRVITTMTTCNGTVGS